MKSIYQIASKFTVFSLLLLVSTKSAFAGGGTVVFVRPSTESIPTLSNIMLIILSVLLIIVAVSNAKRKNTNIKKLFITLLGTGVLITAGQSVKLITDAKAGGVTITFTNSNTVSYTQPEELLQSYENQTMQNLSFSITADTEPSASVCRFRIFPPDAAYSAEATTHTGTLTNGSALQVVCFDPNDNEQG